MNPEYLDLNARLLAETMTPAHESNGHGPTHWNDQASAQRMNRNRSASVIGMLAVGVSGALVGFIAGLAVGGMW